jgi:DNA-binding MarR family transcriptional regulator
MKCSESKYAACLYFTSNALARKMEKIAIESWKPLDLSPSHAYLLKMVLEEPGVQPSIIAGHLQLTPSTVTRLIEKLEERKLIIRTTEGKQTNVYPTPKGKALQPQIQSCMTDFYERSGKFLSGEEYKQLIATMKNITDKIET